MSFAVELLGACLRGMSTIISDAMPDLATDDAGYLARTRDYLAAMVCCRRYRGPTGPQRRPAPEVLDLDPETRIRQARNAYLATSTLNVLAQVAIPISAGFNVLVRNPADYNNDPATTLSTPLGPSVLALSGATVAGMAVLIVIKWCASEETKKRVDVAMTSIGEALAIASGAQSLGFNIATYTVGQHPLVYPIATGAGLVVGALSAFFAPSSQIHLLPVAEASAKRNLLIAQGASDAQIVAFEGKSILGTPGICLRPAHPYADVARFGAGTFIKATLASTLGFINAINSGRGVDTVASALINRVPSEAEKNLAGCLAALLVSSGMWSVHIREGRATPPQGAYNRFLRTLEAGGDVVANIPGGMYPVVMGVAAGAYLGDPESVSIAAINTAAGTAPSIGGISTLAASGVMGIAYAGAIAYLHQSVGINPQRAGVHAYQAVGTARGAERSGDEISAAERGAGTGLSSPATSVPNPLRHLEAYKGTAAGVAKKPQVRPLPSGSSRTAHSGMGPSLPGQSASIELPVRPAASAGAEAI